MFNGQNEGYKCACQERKVRLFAILELSGVFQEQKPQAAEFMRVRNWKGI